MEKADFLSRVRAAAAQGNAYRVHAVDVPERAGYVGGGDDLVGKFIDEVRAVGGEAVRVNDWQQARTSLAESLRRAGVRSAVCWQHPVLDMLGLDELLTALEIRPLRYLGLAALHPDERRTRLLAADVGITSATFAVAETGTLAMASEPGRERLASLIAPMHIAVIERSQILPDLYDLFDRIEQTTDKLSSNWTFITGPSKTGDIELHLTTGVHGPGIWRVIIVDA